MKYNRIIAHILSLIMVLSLVCATPDDSIMRVKAQSKSDVKACWVSYQDINAVLKDKSEADFRSALNIMYDSIIDHKMDTVIMHVRAMGDAMYPSSYYPWSTYISSDRGNPGYDPLKIMVELAHAKGLRFEAWINPYRISLSDTTTNSFKGTEYYSKYSSYIIEYESGEQTCLVLDPSKQEARDLISNGVMEIVSNYQVDAIHFDDYFYVSGMMDQLPEATKKENVNKLVKQVYGAIKSVNPDCLFGISPAGNLSNARAQGADIDTWLSQDGYVDYIMPQIYWSDNYKTGSGNVAMFTNRCNEWKAINTKDKPIYVGLALYRVGEKSEIDLGWSSSSDNLARQYQIAHDLDYDGFGLFRYEWLNMDVSATELINLESQIDIIEGKYSGDNGTLISYTTHVQDYGWQSTKSDGVLSGTTGEAKRLEAISISLGKGLGTGGVTYRTHCQDYGWLPWVSDGSLSGTTGEAKRLEAIQIKLTGEISKNYDIYYRVHAQDYGWLDWASNGEAAGTATYSKRLEAIQIVLVEKGDDAPGNTEAHYITRTIAYQTHVQDYGWQGFAYDGQVVGTTGKSKRLEGIKIKLTDGLYEVNVIYRTHCQDYGWLPWVSEGELSGTTGQSKRLEAIEIKLTGQAGEYYDIYYRVHCQDYGWLPWVSNGEPAGTTGQSKRLEAIEIKLVPKN